MVGLSRYIDKRHICYAALEATAFQTLEIVEAMQSDAGLRLSELAVDGGMTRNALLMQLQADLLGLPVRRAALAETTAWGAALAAGRAVGLWPEGAPAPGGGGRSDSEGKGGGGGGAARDDGRSWRPRTSAEQRAARLRDWHRALERSLSWEA